MEIIEDFIDNEKLLKLHKMYEYQKQYKLKNKQKFNEYALKWYKNKTSDEDKKKEYNLRHNELYKIRKNKNN